MKAEMTQERLDYLRNTKPPKIIVQGFLVQEGKRVNFNDLKCDARGYESGDYFRIRHLTKKGYYSKKAIHIEGLEQRLEKIPNLDRYAIILTDEEYEKLKSVYDVEGKIFQTEDQRIRSANASAMVFLAQRIDFHDRG